MGRITALLRKAHPTLIQTVLGYSSAGLGLVNELLVAARFGANATTDMFRWAGLLPFYATLVGSLAAPLLFRSRLFVESGGIYLLRAEGDGARIQPWVVAISGVTTALCLAAMAVTLRGESPTTMFIAGACLALAQLAFCIGMVPTFLYGATWIYASLSAGSNACILLGILISPSLATAITWSMLAAALFTSIAIHFAPSISPVYKNVVSLRRAHRGERETLAVLAPTIVSNIASGASVTLYFRALTTSGPGVLSIYSVAQKTALLLSVPGNALLNKVLREDSLGNEIGPERVLRSVLPFALAAPIVSLFSFTLLCAVYDLEPSSRAGGMVAIGCSFFAAFSALSLATNMLAIGRSTAHRTIGPSLASVLISGVAAVVIWQFNSQHWIVGVPAAMNGLASVASLMWVSRYSGLKARYAFGLFVLCLIIATLSSATLIRFPEITGASAARGLFNDLRLTLGGSLAP